MFGKFEASIAVRRRIAIGVACAVAGILLLALRLWDLQVIRWLDAYEAVRRETADRKGAGRP